MKRLFISACLFSLSLMVLYAGESPAIWHRPDSLISMPMEDSISWTDEYTVFSVFRTCNAYSTECLWSIAENDTVIHAVLTDGMYVPSQILLSRSARDFSKWCVYTHHGGIRMDSTKVHTFRLGLQYVSCEDSAGSVVDTLHAQIETEELAYYKGNVSRHIAGTFQTYLALKYGITLDYAPYLSQTDDTLWHPRRDEDYYHRVIGVGSDSVYRWCSMVSQSKENTILHLRADTLVANEYILLGDDNGDLTWSSEPEGYSIMQREWRMRQSVKQPHRLSLALQLSALEEKADSIRLMTIDVSGYNIHTILPDSIIHDSIACFTLNNTDTLIHIRFMGLVADPILDRQPYDSSDKIAYFNASNNTIVIDGYPDGQVFTLYLYDNSGKFISRLSGTSPFDISMLPDAVFYIEITADNKIVGAVPIPTRNK